MIRVDPLIIALPVNGKIVVAATALLAQLDVPIKLPIIPDDALIEVTTNPPVTINPFGNEIEPEKYDADIAVVAKDAVGGINVIEVAALDVVANDAVGGTKVIDVAALAVIAFTALFAQLAVPNIVPTLVILFPPNDKSPAIARAPFTNKYCVWSSALNPNRFP